jgi:hypothetical protein
VVDDWYTYNTPDYFNSVCTNTYAGVPINLFGNSQAKQGAAYAGCILFAGMGDTKEYISQHLNTPLIAGTNYCLSFYVSRADGITHAIHNIGALFTYAAPDMSSSVYLSGMPQVENQNGYITDTASWVQIQGCFTANGGEQFITIGNFNSNANTDTLFAGTNNQTPGTDRYAYYYIDDITLYDQTMVDVNELEKKNSFEIYPNPAKDVLTIKSNSLKENMWIKIYNTIGDVVFKESMSSLNSSFNISGLSNGIYFYEVLVGNKIMKTDKIVIIK